jgi:hypothetical protein
MREFRRVVVAFSFLVAAASSARATTWYVDPAGNDSNSCLAPVPASACLTLQAAIDKATAGDTIHVAAGTYASSLVTVDKTLTLLGAQAGIDARTRVGAESVLSNSEGMRIEASAVAIDGFTIQDSTLVFTGFGIFMDPSASVSGTRVVNDIIQNNEVGVGLANAGPSQGLIQHNLIQNNNLPAAASGDGIYTDQFVGRQVTNVLIDANSLVGNGNAGVAFNSTDISIPDSNIEVSNNFLDQNGQGIYFFNTTSANVHDNRIINTTLPADGSSSKAITAFGDVDGLTIMNNDLDMGVNRGIRIVNLNVNPNKNVVIHLNNITNFPGEGLLVDPGGHDGAVDATCNWWGSASGPTNPGNPAGTGEVVAGDATFDPWLFAPAPGGACGLLTTTTTTPPPPTSTTTPSESTTTTTSPVPTSTTTPSITTTSSSVVVTTTSTTLTPVMCQPLNVTQASFGPAASTLHVRVTFPDGTFAGLNPHRQEVHLQVGGAAGELISCTIPAAEWQKLFLHTFGFFDPQLTVCPPIKCLSLTLPKKGKTRATITAARVKPGSPLLSPLEITVSMADQCAAGPLSPPQKATGRRVFP